MQHPHGESGRCSVQGFAWPGTRVSSCVPQCNFRESANLRIYRLREECVNAVWPVPLTIAKGACSLHTIHFDEIRLSCNMQRRAAGNDDLLAGFEVSGMTCGFDRETNHIVEGFRWGN